MKLRFGLASVGVVLFGAHAFAQGAMEPVGTWLTEDGRAKIRTEKCVSSPEKLCGYVVWLKDPLTDDGQPRTDIKNPDPAKRTRPSLGLPLMENLTQADDPAHYAGEIYNADNGKKYEVTLAMETEGELEVKGCMLRILCGSQTWKKVADLPVPNQPVSTKMVQNAGKKAHAKEAAPKE